MKSPCAFATLLAALLLLAALPEPATAAVPSIQLYNNTAYSIDLLNPKSGRLIDTVTPGRGKIVPYRGDIVVRTSDGRILHYNTIPVPREFGRGGFFALMLNAQLNPDYSISLIPPHAVPPQIQPIRQPPGFPLRPQ